MKRCCSMLLALCVLFASARAACGTPEGWVNFRPAEWDRGAAVCALSEALSAEASAREEIPRLVHGWICENICFDEDAFEAGIYRELSASETLRNRRGVCESIANLAQSLLLEAGIPCIKVWGAAIPEGSLWTEAEIDPERINHTWNEYYLDGRWRAMDCAMDMGNRFSAGARIRGAWTEAYFDPAPAFFAETHRCLQRGFDLPEDIPDGWAMPEITEAARQGDLPLRYFGLYRQAVTEREFREMLGRDGGGDEGLRRGEAAVLLAERLGPGAAGASAFADLGHCPERERQAIAALARRGLSVGTGGGSFSPQAMMTRQEAIAVIARLHGEGY